MVKTHPWSSVVIKLYTHTSAPWWVMQTWWEAMRRHHDQTQPLSFTPLTVDLVRDCLPVDHPAAAASELGGTSLLKMFTAWNAYGRRWLKEINQPTAGRGRRNPGADYWVRTYWDDDFPFRLRAMVDPPVVIWSTRPFPWLSGVPSVAVVGSRRISTYGQWATKTYVRDLVDKYGYAIVSGCAPGVDWYAHKTAMRYGGMTVGWVAGGLAGIKPTVQAAFADYECAAVVSEYPPATSVQSWQYAVRNRLISGLADAILVVEAGERSGTLITARAALDQGKDVMVVPQSVWGKNVSAVIDLANNGAFLVSSADDLHGWMQVYGDRRRAPVPAPAVLPPWTMQRLQDRGWQADLQLLPPARSLLSWLRAHQGSCLIDIMHDAFPLPDDQWWGLLAELERIQAVKSMRGVLTLSDMIQS